MEAKRILIKISGEGLSNPQKGLAIDNEIIQDTAIQIKKLVDLGYEIGIVVGGGNFWRGLSANNKGFERNKADYIGMLATIMNGLALQSVFETLNISANVFSSLGIDVKVCQSYNLEAVLKCFEEKKVVILAGGTGRPFFSTDTATALFASEVNANVILMAKNGVDGVYDKDPKKHNDAKRYNMLSFHELIAKNLKVMDLSCATMLQEQGIQVYVFNMKHPNAFIKVLDNSMPKTIVCRG